MARELGPVALSANLLLRDLARKLSAHRDAGRHGGDSGHAEGRYRPPLAHARAHALRPRTEQGRALAIARRGALRARPPPRTGPRLAAAHRRICRCRARTPPYLPSRPQSPRRGPRNPTAESFHEWRKRVKDHWYHLRLLEGLWAESTRAYEKSLKELETFLGDDHNLAVLRERLGPGGETPGLTDLFTAIDRRQTGLRDRAIQLGGRLYAQKPDEFVGHVEELWEMWLRGDGGVSDA